MTGQESGDLDGWTTFSPLDFIDHHSRTRYQSTQLGLGKTKRFPALLHPLAVGDRAIHRALLYHYCITIVLYQLWPSFWRFGLIRIYRVNKLWLFCPLAFLQGSIRGCFYKFIVTYASHISK